MKKEVFSEAASQMGTRHSKTRTASVRGSALDLGLEKKAQTPVVEGASQSQIQEADNRCELVNVPSWSLLP